MKDKGLWSGRRVGVNEGRAYEDSLPLSLAWRKGVVIMWKSSALGARRHGLQLWPSQQGSIFVRNSYARSYASMEKWRGLRNSETGKRSFGTASLKTKSVALLESRKENRSWKQKDRIQSLLSHVISVKLLHHSKSVSSSIKERYAPTSGSFHRIKWEQAGKISSMHGS